MEVYGIDLGTTNSLIGIGDTMLTGLVSSNVDIRAMEQRGRDIVSDDIVASYKTDMSMSDLGKVSITCSTVILKDLAERVRRDYGMEVKDVVISVPAYFSTSQREAVCKAAKAAKLNVKCLINEPTAAAIYLCKNFDDLVVVYDLGGGTFDVSIVDSRLGNYAVIATDGKILGGDDLDMAMVNHAIKKMRIPIRYRGKESIKKMKVIMRLIKEAIQKTGNDQEANFESIGVPFKCVVTVDEYKELVQSVFGETIVRTKYLMERNIPVSDIARPKVVMVGGSSSCPYLRKMVERELNADIVMSDVEPDWVVAKGVAIYAEMVSNGEADELVDDVTKRLCIEDATGKTVTVIDSNTVIPCKSTQLFYNSTKDTRLLLKLYQGDSLVAKNNDYIGTLVYEYGREVEALEGAVELTIDVSKSGIITLTACGILFDCEPQTIQLTAR